MGPCYYLYMGLGLLTEEIVMDVMKRYVITDGKTYIGKWFDIIGPGFDLKNAAIFDDVSEASQYFKQILTNGLFSDYLIESIDVKEIVLNELERLRKNAAAAYAAAADATAYAYAAYAYADADADADAADAADAAAAAAADAAWRAWRACRAWRVMVLPL